MGIATLYDALTIKEIRRDVAEAIEECEIRRISPNQRRYFSTLADKYGLIEAIIEQARNAKNQEDITTNQEIADLFGAKDYSSATLYLKKHLKTANPEIYKIRIQLCLEEGGRRGGESCINSPISKQYGKNDRTNNKNSGNT